MSDKIQSTKLIYIADDDDTIRTALKTFLEKEGGYNVCDFATGDELLEAFEDTPADFVVLDVMMPGNHNGFGVLRELRTKSTVPVILVTARDSDQDYRTGLDLGGDDFFTKPVNPMNIVMRVKTIFRRMEYDRVAFENEEAKKS